MLDSLFRPGTALLGRLRFKSKFLVIGVVFLVPMLAISSLLLRESSQARQFAAGQRSGLEEMSSIRHALELVQKHRGMSVAYLNGASDFAQPMSALGREVQAALKELTTQAFADQGLADETVARWQSLDQVLEQLTPGESFDQHTVLVDDLFGQISHIGEESGLILDPSPDTHYLIGLVTDAYPEVTELMGQARGIGVGVAARGEHTSTSRMTLATLQSQIERQVASIQHGLGRSMVFRKSLSDELTRFSNQIDTTVNRYVRLLDTRVIHPGTGMASPGEITELATAAIDSVYGQFDRLVPLVDLALAEREAEAAFVFRLTLAILALVLVAMAYLFTAFYNNVRDSISRLIRVTGALADGDLTSRAELTGRDEMRAVTASLNAMADNFHSIIRKVSESAEQTAQASEELSALTEESADGIRRQKQDTEQVASAMTELSSTVRDVADNTARSAEAATKATQQATEGQTLINRLKDQVDTLATALGEATALVSSLNQYSLEISSVIDVINDIAEQTNLLALNAAIEAARAGESGRGFAVVADEVRSLAQRTQSSTSQIQQSIHRLQGGAEAAVGSMERSSRESDESVGMVSRTRAAFGEILASVDLISEMGVQIASATEQQSSVSGEMNQNIERIAGVADQAATSAGQIAQASESLSALAQSLAEQVCRFRL